MFVVRRRLLRRGQAHYNITKHKKWSGENYEKNVSNQYVTYYGGFFSRMFVRAAAPEKARSPRRHRKMQEIKRPVSQRPERRERSSLAILIRPRMWIPIIHWQ